ncbi:MAG: hypothetical protein O2968_22995 [Acidobacteria bacterium]|nr:hypothetical protein [Acidobacteriota bacterium]
MIDPSFIVSANIASTLFLAGVIWFVQVVHYPLFSSVGQSGFAQYEVQHAGRTTWIVAPPMLIEATTALLLIWVRPASLSFAAAFAGFLLVGLIWGSTFTMQVPLHARLSIGFEPTIHRNLVATNWVRTAAWTARAWLALTMI